MTRKERLTATLQGNPVDRPPVCFYELDGINQDTSDPNPYNIYNDPSWFSLIELAIEKSDRIVLSPVNFPVTPADQESVHNTTEEFINDKGELCTTKTIRSGRKTFTHRTARQRDVDTCWVQEYLIKNSDDFKEWINLPMEEFDGDPDVSHILDIEERLGDSGIVCLDLGDPLCVVASLFDFGNYTITALTETGLFHQALEKVCKLISKKTEAISRALPGRHWRIYGPEYACPPYLPPRLFEEYVVWYDRPLIEIIKRSGGYPRLHVHGKVNDVLTSIAATGCIGLDPVEPPEQGDVLLKEVRDRFGDQFVLFGNLELSDIETLVPDEFEKKVVTAIEEGTSGSGRGFVLMPSSAPIGRKLSLFTYENYKRMIEVAERWSLF